MLNSSRMIMDLISISFIHDELWDVLCLEAVISGYES